MKIALQVKFIFITEELNVKLQTLSQFLKRAVFMRTI